MHKHNSDFFATAVVMISFLLFSKYIMKCETTGGKLFLLCYI